MRRSSVTSVLPSVAVLLAVACSSSGTSTSTGATTSPTTAAAPSSSAASAGTAAPADLANCRAWLQKTLEVQSIFGVEYAREALLTLQGLDENAPAAVRSDWETLSPLYRAVAESIIANGQNAAQTNEAVAALNASAPQKALANIQAWARANCP
jgi:hypothetical protein